MEFRASRSGPSRLLTADAIIPPPSLAVLVPRGWRVWAVCGWCSRSSTLRPLAGSGALYLLRYHCFEQRLQLMAYSPFLRSRCIRTATQQHGCSGEVLRCPPEEQWGITVGVGVNVRSLVGTSVVVTHTSSGRRRRGAGSRLFGG
jgi:hypothetical protein